MYDELMNDKKTEPFTIRLAKEDLEKLDRIVKLKSKIAEYIILPRSLIRQVVTKYINAEIKKIK